MKCAGCDTEFPKPKTGHRKWCSDLCRKRTTYGGTCKNCGARTRHKDDRLASAPPLCKRCHNEERHRIACEEVIERIRTWVEMFGEIPSAREWNTGPSQREATPWIAQEIDRRREQFGYFPASATVWKLFGSWNEGIRAAGFTPRPSGTYERGTGKRRANPDRAAA